MRRPPAYGRRTSACAPGGSGPPLDQSARRRPRSERAVGDLVGGDGDAFARPDRRTTTPTRRRRRRRAAPRSSPSATPGVKMCDVAVGSVARSVASSTTSVTGARSIVDRRRSPSGRAACAVVGHRRRGSAASAVDVGAEQRRGRCARSIATTRAGAPSTVNSRAVALDGVAGGERRGRRRRRRRRRGAFGCRALVARLRRRRLDVRPRRRRRRRRRAQRRRAATERRQRRDGERGVGAEQAGDALGDPAGGREVEELVGAVGVAAGHEHAGDRRTGRRGTSLAEHAHERDRAALAERPRRLAERRRRHLVERRGEPRRERRGVPARRRLGRASKRTVAPDGGSAVSARSSAASGASVVARRRQADAQRRASSTGAARCRPGSVGGNPSAPT